MINVRCQARFCPHRASGMWLVKTDNHEYIASLCAAHGLGAQDYTTELLKTYGTEHSSVHEPPPLTTKPHLVLVTREVDGVITHTFELKNG